MTYYLQQQLGITNYYLDIQSNGIRKISLPPSNTIQEVTVEAKISGSDDENAPFEYIKVIDPEGLEIFKKDLQDILSLEGNVIEVDGNIGVDDDDDDWFTRTRTLNMYARQEYGLPAYQSQTLEGICQVFKVANETITFIAKHVSEVIVFIPRIVEGVTTYDYEKISVGVDGIANVVLPEGAYVVVHQAVNFAKTILVAVDPQGQLLDVVLSVFGWIMKLISWGD